ncbi:hypothetical protein A3D77_03995 [Candidatus Gottesmanbacteria bacterium RIFCSPHIGHO2_02_FULL_39_11]|uniref:Uncharacterized protein n=1 Tax=Candidatus Gottesmanbacteria bacterium RIFCSPHIGHO2_02_FULL_39_11 TaxID=1798382 RepID=A0A1F5ZJT6_9BACT|nr:MAG: hypothetical protein A3D77_03995 [Candidatus Gottesmanbacteria bacterium RIFCSPHIGHO2_02_FULL_39_11]
MISVNLSGIFLIFSKETGFLIYLSTVIMYLLMYLIIGKSKNILKVFSIRRIFLFIPVFLFFSYLIIKTSVYHQPALWNRQGDILHPILKESWLEWKTDRIPLADLLAVYVLNFNWILTIGTVISFFLL